MKKSTHFTRASLVAPHTTIRSGTDYLDDMRAAYLKSRDQFNKTSNRRILDLQLIGTSLSALYQAGTCHRHCHNNGHVLEALSGRAHNIGAAAVELSRLGLYDEALNLTRGIGEIANLIAALTFDKAKLRVWLESSKKERCKEFSPVKIREMLIANTSGFPILADQEWYSRLCESFTHVTPQTRPGAHGHNASGCVGPVFQEQGADTSMSELAQIIGPLAAMICGYFKFADLLEELRRHSDAYKSQ
jgi:hypothetical protein